MKPKLAKLLDACSTFNPADRQQRILVRSMVIPMLTWKLDRVRVELRADPQNEINQLMHDQIARAVSNASAILDCGLNSASHAFDSAEEIRMRTVVSALGAREKPMRKK